MRNSLTPASQFAIILFLLIISNFRLNAQTFPTPTGFTLPNGKTIVITYDVDVNANACPTGTIPGANLSNQSNVSGTNFATVLTDEPSNPAPNPSPTLTPFGAVTIGDLVYKDVNRNGVFDAGDTGINGVSLNLYLDNGDGVLTLADGALLSTTTTAGGGLYSFVVCPGNYIVEVAPSNFISPNALFDVGLMTALVSSPVGGAADPDNDVNNDDNGDPVAGFGVAAQALTVAYGAEPITDGDALNNTNLSLDFGFKTPTTVTIGDVTMNEGTAGGTTSFNFTVTRNDASEAFSLTVNTMDGTATSPSDFTAISGGSVSFTAGGSLTATVTVLVNADNIVEPNETFTVLISGAPGGVIISDGSGAGVIGNDDAAVVTLSGTVSQNEGTSFVFSATLNNPVQGGFTVAYVTNNGTATTADLDYTDNDGPALIFAGTAGEIKTFTVISTADSKVELDENFTVGLGAVTGPAGITTTGTPQTGTILNDDQAIVSIVPVSQNEGNAGPTIFTFTATLSNAVDVGVGVPFMTSDGTAVDAFSGVGTDDYNSNTGTLNFVGTANETKTFTVQVNGDLTVETNEIFNAILTSIIATGRNVIFTGGTPTLSTTGTIVNDDNAVVTLAGAPTLVEGNTGTTNFVFTATVNNAVQGGFTVAYTTSDGVTADPATTANNDYVDNDANLGFVGNAGEVQNITVLVNGDLNIENSEDFVVALTGVTVIPAGSVSIAGSPKTGIILNDEADWGDAPTSAQSGFVGTYPTLTGANGARHQEFPGGLRLGALLDADADGQPNATATGDGADEDGVVLPASLITGTSANITVTSTNGPGKLDAWVDFNRDGDWADAGEQIFASQNVVLGPNALSFAVPAGASVGTSFARFRLSTAGGLTVTGLGADGEVEDYQVNILNNSFSIDNPSVVEGNASTVNLVFTVTRTTNTNASSVDYAITGGTATVANNDYQALAPGTISFTAGGALSQTITVVVNGDLIVEGNETVIITLSNPVAGGIGASPGTGTITNDDQASLVLSGGVAQAEGNGPNVPYVFTVTLNPTVQGGFTIAYTTNDGTATTTDNDYIDNDGSLVFAGTAGETKTITVNAPGDVKVELNETFTVALGAITGTTAAPGSITISGSPQTGTINNDDAAVVAILADISQLESVTPQAFNITLSNPVDVPVTVLFNTSNGTASTADGDFGGITSQLVTFPAGTTANQVVNVNIVNDTKVEDNEVFNVAISTLTSGAPPRNVSFGTAARTGTILNNDSVNLTLSGGGSAAEGNTGTTGRIFTVTLGPGIQGGFADPDPGSGSVRGSVASVQGGFTVAYSTNDGSGNAATTANNDYVDNDGVLVFLGNANEQKTFTVLGNGDLNIEFDENYTTALGAITATTAVQAAAIIKLGSPQTGVLLNDELDWGDAPTAAQSGFVGTYPTTLANNGARHNLVPNGLHLGATVDADLDGQPDATATGDGADEDGVTLPSALVINTSQSITVNSSGAGFLYGWFDWNRDGDWGDAGEFVYLGTGVVAGNNALTLNVPAGASLGLTYARFRVTDSNQGTSFPAVGLAPGVGEVEDYQVNVVNTQFNIDSPSVLEGNVGTANLVFTISRTNNSTACSVNYAITGGTATTADNDYQVFAGGTASFTQGGALSQTVTVVVNGDLKVELDETVIMTLSTPVNGAIQNGTGTGTITNDDAATITITNQSVTEGDAGTQPMTFTVNMSAVVDANVSFSAASSNGSATAPSDFVAFGPTTLTLTPGQTMTTITVTINGDCQIEANEIFLMILSALNANGRNVTFAPLGATLTGTGTINNEDFLPVITFCPANITINCQDSTLPGNTGTATATDDCPGVLVTSADITVGGSCVNNYTINRTWKATDNTNDMATCLQVITVRDITPPTISCPGNLTVSCVSQVPQPNPESGFMVSDNCGGASISYLGDVISNQTCTNRYLITRSYRATDACGNSASCQQLITVFDNTQPTLTCPPPATFQCASDVPLPNAALVSSTDNCGGVASTSFVNDAITNQTCPNKFTLTRTYRATDVCGNSSTCTQVFTVNDNTVPTLTCPGIITVQCATLVPLPNTSLVTATDNCSGTPTVTHIADVISNQTCINNYTVTRFYRATDLCGNSASCSQTIIVNDNTVPTLTCPVNVTVQCAALVPAVNTAGVVTADNCGPAPTVTFVGDVISNTTCVNRFIVTRTYRTTDACGNSATCNQVITVFDNTAPTLTCPQNLTVQCAADVPVPNIALVVTADNCSGTPTVTFVNDVISNTTCLNRFIVSRTYRSTDICGNSATCVQIITVFDNTAPVITFTESHIANLANGGRFDVQCFGQDPTWDLPVLDESSVSVSDNCAGTVTVGFSQLLFDEGNCPVDGYITMYKLTWTATDVCGNNSTKFVFMALVDHIGPVLFNIPADITVNCDEVPGIPTNIYATDECISAASIQYSGPPPSSGCQNGQVINRSWTATDLCGNKTTKTQHITLVDVKPPVLQMLQPELAGVTGDITFKYTCSEGGIPDFFDDLNAESVYSQPSCGSGVTIKFDKNQTHAVNCKRAGYLEQQTFHWYAVDICGNVTNLTITAQLIDTEPPVIIGVPDVACIDDPELKFVDAIDDCDDPYLQYWDVKIPNPCGSGFAVRRVYEAYDHCGNSSRDTAILIPNDHLGPLMTFVNPKLKDLEPGEVLQIDCEGKAGDYTPFGVDDVSVQDGCSSEVEVTFVEKALSSHGCENGIVASISLEWTATDICGNVSKLTVSAFVVDHTPPVLVNFKSEVTIGCNDDLPAINATDNCGTVTIAIDESTRPGPCEFEYDITRNIVVTDACGNITNATQVVHVGDGSGPDISGVVPFLCDDLSIPDVTGFDPCSGKKVEVTMTEKQLDSGCKEGKVIERTWSATDLCGNVTTIVQIIIVDDHTAPVIQIPTWSIILKYLDAAPGTNFVNLSNKDIIEKLNDLSDGSVYVEDECDEQVVPEFTLEVTYADDCAAQGWFEHRVYTWTATDVCGNSSSISFDVYIVDDLAPVLLGVPKDETYICVPLPAQAVVTSDDPAQPVTIVVSSSIAPGSGPGEFDVERTWTATDACGNVTVASQHITWIPDTFLECDVLTPAQVECNSHGVLISSLVSGGLGGYTYNWSVVGPGFIQSGQGTDQIKIYVGWTTVTIHLTVRDAYGCESECSAVIDCIDTAINPFADTPPGVTPETEVDHGFATTNDQTAGGRLSELTLWPNPTNSSVNLSFESHTDQEVNFRLINFLGQDMLNDKINALKGYNAQKIDVTGLPEGSYLMEVKTDHGVYTKVVVIMRK